MDLSRWQIWHTYSTYSDVDIFALDEVARALLSTGCAVSAILSDGRSYWRDGEDVFAGVSRVQVIDAGRRGIISIDSPDLERLTGLPREMLHEASRFRWSELRMFNPSVPLPPAYVQAMIGPCDLLRAGGQTSARVYVSAKLYAPGVLLLDFRILSPETPVTAEEFSRLDVNIHEQEFEGILVPPGVARLAGRARAAAAERESADTLQGFREALDRYDAAVAGATVTVKDSDFEYELAPLVKPGDDSPHTLAGLAQTLFMCINAALLQASGSTLALFSPGINSMSSPFGGYWEAHSHVHLVAHTNQGSRASENVAVNGDEFGWILTHMRAPDLGSGRAFLTPDLRIFEDYSVFVRDGNSLWAWSELGVRLNDEWSDPNLGHLVYEHQAVIQLGEYGHMLHRQVFQRVDSIDSQDTVLDARRFLGRMMMAMREVGTSGEVRDFLNSYWDSVGVSDLRGDIDRELAIGEAETKLREGRRTEHIGRSLAILFGLIAAPPIGREIILPLWRLSALPMPHCRLVPEVASVALAIALTLTLALLLLRRGTDRGK